MTFTRKAKSAIRLALCGAGSLATLKLILGILSGSMVLIASAIDSMLDFIVSVFDLFALKEFEKPADKEHNYGHGKIEAIASLIEGLIIGCSGLYIVFSSIKKLIYGSHIEDITLGIIAMIISIIITGVIVFILQKTAKKTNNLIVKSDLIHYKMDFLTNTGVILTLFIVKFTGFTLIDPIIAIGIAIYIIYGCGKIIKEGFDLLMDKSLGKDEEIGAIILANKYIQSFHKLKTRQSGGKVFISFHIVFKDENISLKKAHTISHDIESSLKKHFKKASIIIRLDPFDDHQ